MAKRAGKLVMGFDVVKTSLQKDEAFLLLLAFDVSEKTKKETEYLSKTFSCPLIILPESYTLDALWYAIGKRVGVMSVTDEGFANKISTITQ